MELGPRYYYFQVYLYLSNKLLYNKQTKYINDVSKVAQSCLTLCDPWTAAH